MARRQETTSGPPLIRMIDLLAEAEGVSLEDPGAIDIVSKRLAGDLAKLVAAALVLPAGWSIVEFLRSGPSK